MKLTKQDLTQIIKEAFGLDFPTREKKQEASTPVEVLNNISKMWPTQDSSDSERIHALEDMYRLLDDALVGTGAKPGLLKLKEEIKNRAIKQ